MKKGKTKEVVTGKRKGYGKMVFFGFFHTCALLALSYLIVLIGTIGIPTILAYILGGLGFGGSEVQSGSVFIVSMMAGFFLTAWVFVGSFVLVRGIARIYVRNMRNLFTDEMNAKIDRLFNYKKES